MLCDMGIFRVAEICARTIEAGNLVGVQWAARLFGPRCKLCLGLILAGFLILALKLAPLMALFLVNLGRKIIRIRWPAPPIPFSKFLGAVSINTTDLPTGHRTILLWPNARGVARGAQGGLGPPPPPKLTPAGLN